MDRIEREGERLNEMIGQLLALSRIESGTDGLENVRVDLSALVREVAEDADFEARSHDRSVQIIEDEPLQMVGVPELIRSAIENVVRNAIRHTEKHTQVELSLASESLNGNRWAAIRVRDHGRGVPENAIEEIFRPFYRVEDARDPCIALDLPVMPKHVEGTRAKLKRLVGLAFLDETEPGLFQQARPPAPTTQRGAAG